eukprot:Hpha_TRINITY_DN30375_c0_g1::TRINITY_DN30375_c0_g1_i1::g.147066::m.147066
MTCPLPTTVLTGEERAAREAKIRGISAELAKLEGESQSAGVAAEVRLLTEEVKFAEKIRAERAERTAALARIPQYWLNLLAAHSELGEFVVPKEAAAIGAVQSIEAEWKQDGQTKFTRKVVLKVGPNDLISDKELWMQVVSDYSECAPGGCPAAVIESSGVTFKPKPKKKAGGKKGGSKRKRAEEEDDDEDGVLAFFAKPSEVPDEQRNVFLEALADLADDPLGAEAQEDDELIPDESEDEAS